MVERRAVDAADAPAPAGGYAQVVEVAGAGRLAFVSGQIPVRPDGTVPAGFAEQARAAWRNVEAQLRAVGMTLDHVVKLTIYLASRDHALENRAIRREFLGDRKVAMTVVIAGIFDEAWLLEIEAVAAG
jgi:2-iminobutanoate/2-iminopropanoate deaminase